MKITILTPDLSDNSLGRSYLLAQLLEPHYEIEIVGPKTRQNIWKPVRDEYEYQSVDMRSSILDFPLHYQSISRKISGDVVYAVKPRMLSYGYGLLNSIEKDKPIILDIDDWESGFKSGDGMRKYLSYLKSIPMLVNLNSLGYMRMMEKASVWADEITVSNFFLKEKFGGTYVPHVRNTDFFNPDNYDSKKARNELGIPEDKFIVLFSGTPRPHKGVSDLVEAVQSIERDDILLLIVGVHESRYVRKLKSMSDDRVVFYSQQPFTQLPKWIAASDLFVIPQKQTSSTRGQMPAKVFDAMSMGKPIIATEVSDLPRVLEDCGVIVSPDSPGELANKIEDLANDPNERDELGSKARVQCVRNYSYQRFSPKLAALVEEVADH
ncbi:glycosyltransferase family 4 protein [Haloarchaeobius amylolyticus]|uniref:Glycosyltransferase family 4 protein n=1 Tax=Haloarchaeobius amylolyticus TaxID=1198296 RepID=A0ABD6BDE2_9EURY